MDVVFPHEGALCEWSCFYAYVNVQIVGEERIEWPHPADLGEIDQPPILVSRMGSINDHTRAKQSHRLCDDLDVIDIRQNRIILKQARGHDIPCSHLRLFSVHVTSHL